MIINNKIKVGKYIERVPTEKVIISNVIRDKNLISNKYEFMPYPLAAWIKDYGVDKTNNLISSIKTNKIRVFICQHILVNKLKFNKNDIVFTPHATTKANYHSIPHYAVNTDARLIEKVKKFQFSFLGSTTTHQIRKKLTQTYPSCIDTGIHWGIEKKNDKKFVQKYVKMLGNTYFSLCPRGTGISSIRIFEAMAMESIPVIIADGYKFPLNNIINWDDISITIKEKDIKNIDKILGRFSYNKMINKMKDIYRKYFSNRNLHVSVLEALK